MPRKEYPTMPCRWCGKPSVIRSKRPARMLRLNAQRGYGYCSPECVTAYQRATAMVYNKGRAKTRAEITLRIIAKVDTSAGQDGCWPYTGKRFARGYPVADIHRRPVMVRRLVYEHYRNVKLTPGTLLTATCDNRNCCNPAHMTIERFGLSEKMRRISGILTPDDVREIRRSNMNAKTLAQIYHVGAQTIRRVQKRKVWTSVADEVPETP